ncbi:MAG: response regulator [Desulfobacterales bacterium]|nr:response regulator [Desulfobacterales bacterium]
MGLLLKKKLLKDRTISQELIIWLTFTASLIIVVLGTSYYWYFTVSSNRDLEFKINYLTSEFSKVVGNPIWNYDSETIDKISKAYLNSEHIKGIKVVSSTGKIFFESPNVQEVNLIKREAKVKVEDSYAGEVTIFFTDASIKKAQKEMIFAIIITIFSVIMAISICTNLIMKFVLRKRITQLIEGIRIIAGGEYKRPIPLVPQSDINQIITEVNFMASEIYNRTGQLKREIFERKKAQHSLKLKSIDLSKKNKQLKELDRLKDQFLANTSHELRTPLNGIIGIVESLIAGACGNLNKSIVENLKMASVSGRRLLNLVNDILDFSKMRHQKLLLNLKSINLHEIISNVFALMGTLANSKNLSLLNNVPENFPLAYADENRLLQIFNNIIGNSIKFTDKGHVKVESVLTKASQILISVTDTGMGIPKNKQSSMFKSFEQVDGDINREYGGTGLGLAITKSLVEAHGGDIGLKSEKGKGTTIFFTLPLSDKLTSEPELQTNKIFLEKEKSVISKEESEILNDVASDIDEETDLDQGIKLDILAVDDEKINLLVLNNYLKLHKYKVTSVTNGADALFEIEKRAASGNFFDIVLLDVMMPKMNGFDVTRRIRQKYNHFELPVLLLTAMNQAKDVVSGFASGSNDYIKKPLDKDELSARINIHYNLKQVYNALKMKFDENSKALEKARDVANEASRIKSDFLANMSHEIRTPMNGVIAASELALELDISKQAKHYLRMINSSGISLLGIINDILDFSKIESGKLDLEKVNFSLEEVIDKIVNIFFNKCQEKGIELLVDRSSCTPMNLLGDPLRLQQIIINLVSNAVKFTDKGGVVTLGIDVVEKISDQVLLKIFVKDTGIGIKDDTAKNLFNPFIQADSSTTRKYGGTGLGLAICKKLVEMMDGNIWLEKNKIGKGTTFYFTARLSLSSFKESSIVVPNSVKHLNILVVDDCLDSRTILHKLLTSFGFNVDMASSGQEALSFLKKHQNADNQMDVIIMDWLMPELDGIETSKVIRTNLKITSPIIMLTAFGKDGEKRKAQKAGINAFLHKPANASSMLDTIMDVCGKEVSNITAKEEIVITKASIYKKRLKGTKILVAEDNVTNQEIAKAVLEGAGIAVEIANNGKEAINVLQTSSFDAVLMDIQMPEMDGFKATAFIREDLKLDALPIIAMTAHAMKGDDEKCLKSGMNGYITKPINQENLFRTLSKFISLSKFDNVNTITETDSLPSKIPGIDISEALLALNLDHYTFKKILLGFSRNNKGTVDKIFTVYDKKDWQQLRNIAHSLKGSSANIGAKNLRDFSEIIENACSEGKIISIDLIKKVESALAEVLESIEKFIEVSNNVDTELEGVKTISKDELERLIENFVNAVEIADPEAIEDNLKSLSKSIKSPLIVELEVQIRDYEYDEALKTLKKIGEII